MAYNVLIVDDSASMRSIVAKALRLSGVPIGDVHMAGDGLEALDVLDRAWVDIVLADLNMPNMGGMELIERMKDRGITARVPVVVVSTESRQEVIRGLLGMGAVAFLRKPFAPEQLGDLLQSVLAAHAEPPAPEVLATAFYDALEGFAMLVADEAAETPAPPADAHAASIAFTGPGVSGALTLSATPEATVAIARSATGEELADGHDALAELANVTAGQLISRLAGGPFELEPPVRLAGGGAAWEGLLGGPSALVFDVEGHHVVAGVELRKRW